MTPYKIKIEENFVFCVFVDKNNKIPFMKNFNTSCKITKETSSNEEHEIVRWDVSK